MKSEHLKSNMKLVREDIEATLENIENIKGRRYRHYVETLLLANQVLEASNMAISRIEDDPLLKSTLSHAIQQNMSGILSIFHAESGFSEQEMEELLNAGDKVIANFKAAATAALKASRSGYSIKE